MLTLPDAIVAVLVPFATLFTSPTPGRGRGQAWRKAQVLLVGAILTPGQRTVAAALRVMGRSDDDNYSRYHEVLNRAVWSSREVARVLLVLLLQQLDRGDGPLIFGIDETLERRRGAKIKARAIYRDPVRSSRQQLVKASGLRWISLMWLGHVPWAGRHWALPVLTVLAPSTRYYQQRGRRHKKLTDWARQMVMQLRRWLPQRTLVLVGDNSYAVLDLLHCCQSLREPVTLIARLRLDAALYAPAPARQPGQKGCPRLKGARRPPLKALLPLELGFNLQVALGDLGLVGPVKLQGLGQLEDMLLPPVPLQRLGDGLLVGLGPGISQPGQPAGIPFPLDDGFDDVHARLAGDVADHVLELHVHLGQRLLHVLDVLGGMLHQHGPLPQVAAQAADLILGPEGPRQQTVGMQLLQPLAVQHVRFPARHVLDASGVHQQHLEPALLQHAEERYPVDPGRLQDHRLHTAFGKPVGQAVQVRREGLKLPHRLLRSVGGNRCIVAAGAHVDARRVQVQQGQSRRFCSALVSAAHYRLQDYLVGRIAGGSQQRRTIYGTGSPPPERHQ